MGSKTGPQNLCIFLYWLMENFWSKQILNEYNNTKILVTIPYFTRDPKRPHCLTITSIYWINEFTCTSKPINFSFSFACFDINWCFASVSNSVLISSEKFLELTDDSKSIHSRYHRYQQDTNFPILSTLRILSCIYYSLAHLSCIL